MNSRLGSGTTALQNKICTKTNWGSNLPSQTFLRNSLQIEPTDWLSCRSTVQKESLVFEIQRTRGATLPGKRQFQKDRALPQNLVSSSAGFTCPRCGRASRPAAHQPSYHHLKILSIILVFPFSKLFYLLSTRSLPFTPIVPCALKLFVSFRKAQGDKTDNLGMCIWLIPLCSGKCFTWQCKPSPICYKSENELCCPHYRYCGSLSQYRVTSYPGASNRPKTTVRYDREDLGSGWCDVMAWTH